MKQVARIPIGIVGVLAIVGLLGLVLATTVSIVDGPYRPDRYAGGIDPIRAGFVAFLVASVAMLGLFSLAALIGWRMGVNPAGLALGVFWAGIMLAVASLLAMIASMPLDRTFAVPVEIRIPFFLGLGVAIVGIVPSLYRGSVAAVRRRDLGLLVAIAVLLGLVLVGVLSRR